MNLYKRERTLTWHTVKSDNNRWLIFVQKAFLPGLFSGELIFGGAYYWKEFCISKWVGLVNTAKTLRKQLKQLSPTVHGLIIGRIFVSEI